MVELALMSPWIFFLFVGIFDFGYFTYASTCVESAARQAAVRTAQDTVSQTQAIACTAVLAELNQLPNVGSFSSTCAGSGSVSTCIGASSVSTASPLCVAQTTLCGASVNTFTIPACSSTGVPGGAVSSTAACADCASTADPTAAASLVTISYQSVALVPIPGDLKGVLNMTREAEVRIAAQ